MITLDIFWSVIMYPNLTTTIHAQQTRHLGEPQALAVRPNEGTQLGRADASTSDADLAVFFLFGE